MKLLPWRTGNTVVFDGDDVNESIIDALSRKPAPYGGDWEETKMITQGSVPMAVIPRPDPPSKHARPELHVTPAHGLPRPSFTPRPSRGRILIASRATLPVFHSTTHIVGWRAFILPRRPSLSTNAAIRAIAAYTERTFRVICQQVEVAKGDLWERARDFDEQEAKLRRPLNMQKTK